jgi:cytochrome oxidase assembly protein ShyY1
MSGYGFLRQPRWLSLGFLVLLVVPSFILLSRWQLHRLDEDNARNAALTANSTTAPVAVDRVMTSGAGGATIGVAQTWRQVTATGTYDVAHQRLVRKRPFEGQNGFWVATPLVTESGAVLVVNRGWLGASGDATSAQAVPPPPTGEVTVVGRVQPSEQAPRPQPADLPTGQVTDLDVSLIADGSATYPGYVDLVSSTPADSGLTPIGLPDPTSIPHLSYAVQWVFFALVAVAGFVLLVRREREYLDSATRTDVA